MAAKRLVLFDIDGTLVRAGPIGAAVFNRAVEAVLGEAPTERVRMSGKTDPQIVREYLALVESDDPSHLPAVLEHLERELASAAAQIAADGETCRESRPCFPPSRPTTASICPCSRGTSPRMPS